MKRPDPQADAVEMQPLMVDPYFDKSFAPEPSTFSAVKLAAVVSTIAVILVIGIAVSSRGQTVERSQTEKTDPFFVNKLTKMMMPNGWIRLRAATTPVPAYSKSTGYIFLSQYEYGSAGCSEDSLQIQHGTETGLCVAGQDIYGDVSTSGVYSCSTTKDKVIWEFQHFNSTDCSGNTLKAYKYEYPVGCSIGDKVDASYVFQAGCSESTVAPYTDITKSGYLLGSAVTDEECDAGDEFYYSWVKTDACLKGLDNGQGSRKFSQCSGMAVTVSLYKDPLCAVEEYSSVTSFECDVTDDYFYYYYDDGSTDGEGSASSKGPSDDDGHAGPTDDDGGLSQTGNKEEDDTESYGNETYYADDADGDDDEENDDADDGEDDGKSKKKASKGDDKSRRRLSPSNMRRLSDDDGKSKGDSAEEDDDNNTDDLAIFRNYVFGKCLSNGPMMRTSSSVAASGTKSDSIVLADSST